MVKWNGFCSLWDYILKGEINFYSDEMRLYLTDEMPIKEIHSKKSDLKGIKEEHGYQEVALDTIFVNGGCYKKLMVKNDIRFVATKGDFGPFRYAIIYNNSHKDKILLSYLDFGEHIKVKTRIIGEDEKVTISFYDNCLLKLS